MSLWKAHLVTKYFGYLCKKICYQELSKIAQSGHTEGNAVTGMQVSRGPGHGALSKRRLREVSRWGVKVFDNFCLL